MIRLTGICEYSPDNLVAHLPISTSLGKHTLHFIFIWKGRLKNITHSTITMIIIIIIVIIVLILLFRVLCYSFLSKGRVILVPRASCSHGRRGLSTRTKPHRLSEQESLGRWMWTGKRESHDLGTNLFFLRDSRASETQARVKINPREKGISPVA